jgi:hypothetical protein
MQTQISDDSPLESEFYRKFRFRSGTKKELINNEKIYSIMMMLNKQRNIVYHERRQILRVY